MAVRPEGGSNNSQPNPRVFAGRWAKTCRTLSAQQLGILRDIVDAYPLWRSRQGSPPSYAVVRVTAAVSIPLSVAKSAYAFLVDGKSFQRQTVQGIGLIGHSPSTIAR